MAANRSPNYPSLSLKEALSAIRPAFDSEGQNKMSRQMLAKHLGYSSLSGRALSKIGAVRAYGLIEGSGDELRVSDDAVAALRAPQGDRERDVALLRCALRPPLFKELQDEFSESTPPSQENLQYALIKRHFTPKAAGKAAESYLATFGLVSGEDGDYDSSVSDEGAGANEAPRPRPPTGPKATVKMMAGERELTAGLLSKNANFRLIVSGQIGVKEIDRLIKKLEMDRDILMDDPVDEDQEETDTTS